VPYSQPYLFNAIPDTNHNANPTNPNTRYRCEYGALNSMFAKISNKNLLFEKISSSVVGLWIRINCVCLVCHFSLRGQLLTLWRRKALK